MKLLLFSDQNHSQLEVRTQLVKLTGKSKPTIGYISSCPDPSRQFYEQTKQYYARFEAKLTPCLDLESGFDSNCLELVFQADAIHLSGGNTYQFFYWILRRGLRERLYEYARSDKVIIGVSAGSIIMTPDVSYAELCGDYNHVGLKTLNGLALVNFNFVPHAIAEDTITQNILHKSQQDNSRVVVASDNNWLVVDGSNIQVYGKPKLIVDGKIVRLQYL